MIKKQHENTLLDRGIILLSSKINKNKIDFVSEAIAQSLTEMVWVTKGGDLETINRLTGVLVTMNVPADRGKLFKVVKLAVATDGTAVLDLGDTGPEAGMPIMESKCGLLKEVGDVDAVFLCVCSKSTDDIIKTVTLLPNDTK